MLPIRPRYRVTRFLVGARRRSTGVSASALVITLGSLAIAGACRTAPRAEPAPEICLGQEVLAVNNLTQRSVDVYEARGGNSRIIGTVSSGRTEFPLPPETNRAAGYWARLTNDDRVSTRSKSGRNRLRVDLKVECVGKKVT
jgi:hypothetical protein